MSSDQHDSKTNSDKSNGTSRQPSVRTGAWNEVDFTNPETDTYPSAWLEREQWMGHRDKRPFAPWGDQDHPEAAPGVDARYKWSLSENYLDGEEIAVVEDHPSLDGRVFIQHEEDPFAFIDGDNIRDPETGEVHPTFIAILEHLGLTYADVSISGTGIHAPYLAPDGLPIDGKEQASFPIDTEPWGTNDELPSIEIYANTHVCVTTGLHVPGTPGDIREWNADALESILRANGYDDTPEVNHDTNRDWSDLDEYEPDATAVDETTEDVRDVLAAIDRLRPQDVPLETHPVGTDSTGWETWDPSTYRYSSGKDSLHTPDRKTFYDHKQGETFGVLKLFALEQGILSRPGERLAGEKWWEAIEKAREAGAPIPRYVGEPEPVGVLPPAKRDLTIAASGWDWRQAAKQDEETLTVSEARQRTTDAIAKAYTSYQRVLVEALPTMGKSYGAVKAAAETETPVTILTGRGHKEQYDQFTKWCDEFDLKYYTLPSFTRHCSTANGTHGDDWADTVLNWYVRGATPKKIHKTAEYVLDRPLPCHEHEHQRCPYSDKWDFEPDEFDVLIGHYAHAYKPKVTIGRAVVFDEFTDTYETTLDSNLQRAVSYWLEATPEVPFDSYTDLIENRDDQDRRGQALHWFIHNGIEPDEMSVFDDDSAHAAAPIAVYTLLASDDLGNGFEHAEIDDGGVAVFNREVGEVSILHTPGLDYASSVVALDGTPTKRMWELALGESLTYRPVLEKEERAEYIRDALNLNLVRTTEYIKPYNPRPEYAEDRIAIEKDAALLDAIVEKHDQRPALITTTTALREYDRAGVIDFDLTAATGDRVKDGPVDCVKWYGDVLGSNEFDETRLGVVIGSNHYGDEFIKKWGAYAGQAVERNGEKGSELSYGRFGDQVLQHMREHDTLQAAMRFGRDGRGAVVYVHTDTLPEWVPLVGEGRVVTTWSDGMKAVVHALEELGEATTAAIVEHPAVDLSRQQVFNHLETLRERGVLTREQDEEDGRRVVWRDEGLHCLGEHGDVDLDSVELEELDDDEEIRQLARTSTYTWEFTNLPGEKPSPSTQSDHSPSAGDGQRGIEGNPT
ncbi:MarR family transcriptional regulator [Halorubrum vacuolatum]|uniref:Uncharacterized protein n=1 Tax=Halorubrum vacuolatum TaxID=63740 RepID=A0A238WNN8_HALVU|nr:helix-turn-helix domain-containing protein [Halorubrum vacuolatum]SNR48038.1 hypothetical protein SAMN06264855_1097 [Halorubrum vacuolatum]